VNTPITRLFGLVVLLFAVLVFATSWWTEFGAQRLRDNPLNRRQLLEDAKVKRGRILADDGSILARSAHCSTTRMAARHSSAVGSRTRWCFECSVRPTGTTEQFRTDGPKL